MLKMLPFSKDRSIFDPPTRIERIIESPLTFIATLLYHFLLAVRPSPGPHNPPIRIVCISDTHTLTAERIPDGDLLIHAGDLTNAGTTTELQAHIDWLATLPHKQKVAIAGNHDTYLDPRSRVQLDEKDRTKPLDWKDIHYLQHSSITLTFPDQRLRKLKIYGAPQIPKCGGSSFAFQYPRELDAWTETVPDDTDILVTHTPPKYHCDLDVGLGCQYLLKEVWRVRPKLHVCGHVHAGAGREVLWWDRAQSSYEQLRERREDGLISNLIDPRVWLHLALLLFYGMQGVLWTQIWGGVQRTTVLINAALTYNNTGRLGNKVQVIDL